ncbi:NUDIX domain-containing protein [bacterium]|nr:NUDIX domain-containing protein [bacterium]MBU1025328.1 NUDIX domain-containing protein [bacterium]
MMPHRPFSLSVKMLISDERDRWLFIKRSDKSRWNPGKWDIPGGKLDPGESFREGLLREVEEETGLDVRIKSHFGSIEDETNEFRIVHLVMNGKRIAGDVKLSNEHMDYTWVSKDESLELDLCPFIKNLIQS